MVVDRDHDASRQPDELEDVLADCLEAPNAAAALDRACAEHPDHAAELRRRYQALCRAGLAPSQPAILDAQPRQLGPYRLVDRIGGGGMGVVWRAVEEPFGREVAVKLVRAEQLYVESARRRFLREIEAVAKLKHPGIVPVYGIGEHGEQPYYAMELVPGRSAAQVLQSTRAANVEPTPDLLGITDRSSWADACAVVVAQVARALQHAHERNIVHRDVKPSNIMIADDGRVLVIDFGLAQIDGAEPVTRSGMQPGSPTYMSPEQVRGEAVDHRTDIWSLGVTLYELIGLRPPFEGDSTAGVQQEILTAEPRPLTGIPGVSWEIGTIVATALAPEPDRRYQSAAAFAADLEAALDNRPIQARRPGPWLRLRRYAQRHQVRTTAVGLLLLLVTVLPTALLVQANLANAEILAKATTAETTVTFLQGLFREVDPERARGTSMPVRVFLDRGVQRARRELADQPEVHAALLETLGSVYLDLGLFAEAEQLLTELEPLRRGATADARIPMLMIRARVAALRGRHADSERQLDDVLRLLPALGRGQDALWVDARLRLAEVTWLQDRLDEAERIYDAVIGDLRRQNPVPERLLLDALLQQIDFLSHRRDPLLARPLLSEIEQLAERTLEPDSPQRIVVADRTASCLGMLGETEAAIDLFRRALAMSETILDARHPIRGALHMSLAVQLAGADNAEASQQIDRALATFESIHEAPHPVLAAAWNTRSSVDYELGDFAACERSLQNALRMYEQLAPNGSIQFATALGNMCRLSAAMGRVDAAVEIGRRSTQMARECGMTGAEQLAMSLGHLAYALALNGAFDESRGLIDEAIELCAERPRSHALAFVRSYAAEIACFCNDGEGGLARARAARETWRSLGQVAGESWAIHVEGWALGILGRLPEAETAMATAVRQRRQSFGSEHPLLALSLSELGVAQARLDRLEDAAKSLAEAVAICRATSHDNGHNLVMPMLNHAAVLDLLKRSDDALPHAFEVADLVEGKLPVGHRFAAGTARLMLRLHPKIRDPNAQARLTRRLRSFAASMLPTDHPIRARVDELQ